jgi:hypothetical protein
MNPRFQQTCIKNESQESFRHKVAGFQVHGENVMRIKDYKDTGNNNEPQTGQFE